MGRSESEASEPRMNGDRCCRATQICVYLVVHLRLDRPQRRFGGFWDFEDKQSALRFEGK